MASWKNIFGSKAKATQPLPQVVPAPVQTAPPPQAAPLPQPAPPPAPKTPIDKLFDAARKGDVAAIQQALKDGADVDGRKNISGTITEITTALYCAVQGGHKDAVIALLEAGADLNVQDTDEQKTPLCTAAYYNKLDIAKILLAAGADTALEGQCKHDRYDEVLFQGDPAKLAHFMDNEELGHYVQSIMDDPTQCPTPESVGLNMNKRIASLKLLDKPLDEFTEAEATRLEEKNRYTRAESARGAQRRAALELGEGI